MTLHFYKWLQLLIDGRSNQNGWQRKTQKNLSPAITAIILQNTPQKDTRHNILPSPSLNVDFKIYLGINFFKKETRKIIYYDRDWRSSLLPLHVTTWLDHPISIWDVAGSWHIKHYLFPELKLCFCLFFCIALHCQPVSFYWPTTKMFFQDILRNILISIKHHFELII